MTGDDLISEAWRKICDSWVGVSAWLSQKPVIFCRQYHLDDEYTVVPPSDLIFLRWMDGVLDKTIQHQEFHKRRMDRIAEDTPVGKRDRIYSAHLDAFQKRNWMLGMLIYRLLKFTDQQFDELAENLGIVRLTKFEI